jgi:hypothetical protein
MKNSYMHLILTDARLPPLAFLPLPRLMLALVWLLLQSAVAPAQQREPAFEIDGLTGAYFHGNLSISGKWKPQFGAGAFGTSGQELGDTL